VRATNDAPVAGDDAATTEENHPVTLTAAALLGNDEDVDGDAPRVLAAGEAQRGLTRVNPDGSVTYTPGLDFAGIDQFPYRVSDGHGGNATGTVSITVTPADDPPVMTADAVEATAVVAGAAALAMVVAGPMAAAVAMVAAGATGTAAATAAGGAGGATGGVTAERETGGPGGPAAGRGGGGDGGGGGGGGAGEGRGGADGGGGGDGGGRGDGHGGSDGGGGGGGDDGRCAGES